MGPFQPYRPPPPAPPTDYNQFIRDPLGHFFAVPWTAKLLMDPSTVDVAVADRRARVAGDKLFVQSTLNSEATVRACVQWLRAPSETEKQQARAQMQQRRGVGGRGGGGGGGGGGTGGGGGEGAGGELVVSSGTAPLLQGGGAGDGEDPLRPFLLLTVLLDLGEGLCGFGGTLHGGALLAVMDEVLCAAADNQSNYAFTATMATKFVKPVKLPGIVVVRARVAKREGRKIYVKGSIEDKDGDLVAESEALLIDKHPGRSSKL